MRAMLMAGLLLLAGFASAWAGEATVTIDNFSFTPAQLTVPAGTRVTWVNQDDIPHLVLGTGKTLLKSPPLDTDDKFSATFDTAGTFAYFCSLHPHMQGTIVVQ